MAFFNAAFARARLNTVTWIRLLPGLIPLSLFALAHAETATLQHDNNGNVTQRITPLGTTTYSYDPLNRLTGESGPAKTQTITYDENGNRLSDGAGNYTYEPTSNRMSTRLGLAVTFDQAGNLTADGTGRTFTYTQANQLYQVFQGGILLATYTYDFTGLRIAKVTTASAPQGAQTVIYEYDEQEHLISELSGIGAPLRTYVWRDDTPVAQIEHASGTDKFLYYEVDHLNTPRAAMDETGKVVWRWESDAFGSTLPDEDPDKDGVKVTVNLRFWGYQYYDVESGLHYNGHRYYSPLLRIFTQTDRLDLLRRAVNPLYAGYSGPTDLQRALNQPYTYVDNNSMSFTDPLGLDRWGDTSANYRYTPKAGKPVDAATSVALTCYSICVGGTGQGVTVTAGKEGGHSKGSAHETGQACDIGKNSNPDLTRQKAEQCYNQCFPPSTSYGQEEDNHYHMQSRPGKGGATGFAPGVH